MGDIIQDQLLFATDEVTAIYQPLGVVIAGKYLLFLVFMVSDDLYTAHKAKSLVKVKYSPLEAILSIDEAIEKESFFPLWRNSICRGNPEEGFKQSEHTLEGSVYIGGQEHFYFEPNVTLVEPLDTEFRVYSSTQNLHKTQSAVAHVSTTDVGIYN